MEPDNAEELRKAQAQLHAAETRIRTLEQDSHDLMEVWRVLGVCGPTMPCGAYVRELQDCADILAEATADLLQSAVYQTSENADNTALGRILSAVNALQAHSTEAMGKLRAYWELRKRNTGR
ncbi:hypothetical protein [Caudoviricetes sp.]|nr:hypothetical protein [Caudoviricetes sp.]UOF79674.1 hypothetical protein [Caudoviricetes sp.]UOF79852.1 hypothetical protein [Bacteriophage sp.]UOF81345.1 hypothetical protein [Caudoviricetes sp.]